MTYSPVPFKEWFLSEENGHTVAVYEYGNPSGVPVIVSHGGPGGKSKPKHLSGFGLKNTHVIAFDQRGCGNSRPSGKLEHNTTDELINDMERIRTTLQIDQWYVSGASWGSTLSLIYAQKHSARVKGLLLSSIFLANNEAQEWAISKEGGVETFFPDAWQHRDEMLAKYKTNAQEFAKSLIPHLKDSLDESTRYITAGIINWESNLITLGSDLQYVAPTDIADNDINSVRIMLHYEANNYFLSENQILNQLKSIAHIPTIIVHGRYDVLCPIKQAWQVHQSMPQSELIILPSSGHRLSAEGALARSLAYQKFLISKI